MIAALLITPGVAAANGTLAVSPNPAVVGDSLVFSGCGYTPGQNVQMQAIHNTRSTGYVLQIEETVDAGGCFSTADFPYIVPESGKWTLNVYDFDTGAKVAATLNFFVT